MIRLELQRMKYRDKQTLGRMDVYQDDEYLFTLATLEQEWRSNERSNSCVPPGFYIVEHYSSQNHPNTFILRGTAPRTYILIHSGNYHTHTAGCILVGLTHADINKDGYIDTVSSVDAMNKLRQVCKGEKTISINIKA